MNVRRVLLNGMLAVPIAVTVALPAIIGAERQTRRTVCVINQESPRARDSRVLNTFVFEDIDRLLVDRTVSDGDGGLTPEGTLVLEGVSCTTVQIPQRVQNR